MHTSGPWLRIEHMAQLYSFLRMSSQSRQQYKAMCIYHTFTIEISSIALLVELDRTSSCTELRAHSARITFPHLGTWYQFGPWNKHKRDDAVNCVPNTSDSCSKCRKKYGMSTSATRAELEHQTLVGLHQFFNTARASSLKRGRIHGSVCDFDADVSEHASVVPRFLSLPLTVVRFGIFIYNHVMLAVISSFPSKKPSV